MIKIRTITGNLLNVESGWIVHCANSHGIMGTGVAAGIKQKYPAAFKHYRKQYEDIGLELGTNNVCPVSEKLMIVNLIGQEDFGTGKRFVSYDALCKCFENLNTSIKNSNYPIEIHIPKLGAARAGGNWEIIREIIEQTSNYPVTLWLPDSSVTTL